MGRSLMLIGFLVGSLALSSTGLRTSPIMQRSRSAVLLRYRYAPGETLAYAYRERITNTSAAAPSAPVTTTTALLTYRQRLHIVRVSATGVATAALNESRRTLTTTSGGHSSVVTQPAQPASTMALYPDGRSHIRTLRSTATGIADNAPVFPAYPVSPGAQWNRPGILALGAFFVRPPVIPTTEHLTFTGYGVVNGERVAEITISVKAQRPGTAPQGSMWPNAPVMTTDSVTSTLAIRLSSGDLVRVVQDRATTVREIRGKQSATSGGWFRLATHTEMRRI